jgi:hypothetical protein
LHFSLKMSTSIQEAQRIIFCYFGPALILVCLAGNLITFVVYSRKTFRNRSFSFYVRMLNIVDSLGALLFLRIVYRLGYGINTNTINQFFCTFGSYSIMCITVMSAHLLCMISFDRMASIVFINRFGFLKKRSFQVGAILAIVTYSLVAYVGKAIFYEMVTIRRTATETIDIVNEMGNLTSNQRVVIVESRVCMATRVPSVEFENVYFIYDLFNTVLLPFSLMIAFSTMSILKIHRSRAKASAFKSGSSAKPFKLNRKDRCFAIVSITSNLVFLILNTPIVVYLIISNNSPTISAIYEIIARLLFYSTFGSMFFINILTNKQFKRELHDLMFKPKVENEASTSMTTMPFILTRIYKSF